MKAEVSISIDVKKGMSEKELLKKMREKIKIENIVLHSPILDEMEEVSPKDKNRFILRLEDERVSSFGTSDLEDDPNVIEIELSKEERAAIQEASKYALSGRNPSNHTFLAPFSDTLEYVHLINDEIVGTDGFKFRISKTGGGHGKIPIPPHFAALLNGGKSVRIYVKKEQNWEKTEGLEFIYMYSDEDDLLFAHRYLFTTGKNMKYPNYKMLLSILDGDACFISEYIQDKPDATFAKGMVFFRAGDIEVSFEKSYFDLIDFSKGWHATFYHEREIIVFDDKENDPTKRLIFKTGGKKA